MKIALVHDDLIQFGGAEKLLMAFHGIWPEAPIYTSVVSRRWRKICTDKNIKLNTSFMQNLPFVEKLNREYSVLFFHALAFENFNFDEFDVVLSVSSRYAHSITTKPETIHVCYMNTPGRMFWEPKPYFMSTNFILRTLVKPFLTHLRMWDYICAQRVDHFIANSKTSKERIKKYYNRNSEIIHPYVDIKDFNLSTANRGYFLIVSRLQSWKRIDLAVKACSDLNLKLKIVGEGPAQMEIKRIAGDGVEFLGYVSENEKKKLLENCIAFINTQYEDFGISSLEALACGKPVIAYAMGGVLETVIPGKTGIFFYKQSAEELKKTLKDFRPENYDPLICRASVEKFDKIVFMRSIKSFIESAYEESLRK